ncbi:MAG TPA: phosphoadenylyl-sulfate reductase [Acidimicrobiales bacterium]|nr:phosphoadenylyl-sulfate reductase [Acidimicrobiales bacterium]
MSDTLAGRVVFDDLEIGEIAIELDDREPQEVIEWALETLGEGVAVVTALQADGMAILDMAYRIKPEVKVLTVDTLRLPEATYRFVDEVRRRYPLADLEVLQPDGGQVAELEARQGRDGFFQSVPARLTCCQVRKVRPLVKALEGFDGWITGLRRDQWASRAAIRKVELDHDHDGIVKVNPLADWTKDEVWEYIKDNEVPSHPLYSAGYTSIGCDPCTRPVGVGEDERAGRWWWEVNAPKECGIHCPIETGGFEHEAHAILTDHD